MNDIIERISSIISGFKGYVEKTTRIDDDRMVREYTVNLFMRGKKSLIEHFMSTSTYLVGDVKGLIDMILYRVDRLVGNIKNADKDYENFFDRESVDLNEVRGILDLDLKIITLCRKISDDMVNLPSKSYAKFDIRNRLMMILEALKVLEDRWRRRVSLIKKIG